MRWHLKPAPKTNMPDVDVNMLAVLIAGLVYFVIGGLWYSQGLFGKIWMKHTGIKKPDKSKATNSLIVGFVAGLVTNYVLAIVIASTAAVSFTNGAVTAFWMWLGFMLPVSLMGVLWEGRKMPVFWIHASYMLVAMLVSGGILAIWV